MTPGAVYTQEWRAGVESVYGTAVAPTRKLYVAPDSGLSPGGSNRRHSYVTGTRSQVRSASQGVQEPSGSFSLPMHSAEILEMLRIGHNSAPTITTPDSVGAPAVRLHVSTGGGALSSATLQWHDGARPWQATGAYANSLRVEGAANGENVLSGDLIAAAMTQTALSGTVTDRTLEPTEGWETKLSIDSVSGTDNYGTTLIAAGESVVNWSLVLAENNVGRLYTAANTRAMQAATMGVFESTGSLTFVASGARSLTEYNDFVAGTQKRIRLRFGDNDIVGGALLAFVDIDVQVVWTEFNLLGEEAGVRTYEASFGFVHDNTNGFPNRVRAQSARASAF